MKKRIVTLAVCCACILSLASCGQDISKEAAEKGKNYFDSGEYETAAKAFALAIDNGNTDEEIKLLYDITLAYYQANEAFKGGKTETAHEIISSIDEKYVNYGIKEKILTLENNINKAMESEQLLDSISDSLVAKDYSAAASSIKKIDISSLNDEQADRLNEYKTTIASAQAEAERLAEEQKAAEEAAKKAAEEKKQAANNKAKNDTSKNTAANNSTPAKNNSVASVKVQPAINTNVSNDTYIYPTDTTLLTAEQLKTLNKTDLALIRNEIYARKGHIFTTDKYKSYFGNKTWYNPTATIYWSNLNDIEKANIKLIKEYEGKL